MAEKKFLHIYLTDGSVEKRHAPKKPTLEEMQELVGGYIEFVNVTHEGHKRTMVVNEEGLLQDVVIHNAKASAIAQRVIVGTAFVMEGYR